SDTLDLRQLCLSLCTAAGLRTPESLLHTAFPLYDSNGDGLLSAEDLSGLMAALVGVAQHSIAEMYTELTDRGQPAEGELYDLLMTHPTYKKLFKEYFGHEELRHVADRNHNGIPNGKTSRNNNGIHNPNGLNKKSEKGDEFYHQSRTDLTGEVEEIVFLKQNDILVVMQKSIQLAFRYLNDMLSGLQQ
ncbi:lysophospholipid acyltransferase LPCAT4 isoform X1, partial [Tachysurus ichikawai]